jgi:hypothetical protein
MEATVSRDAVMRELVGGDTLSAKGLALRVTGDTTSEACEACRNIAETLVAEGQLISYSRDTKGRRGALVTITWYRTP